MREVSSSFHQHLKIPPEYSSSCHYYASTQPACTPSPPAHQCIKTHYHDMISCKKYSYTRNILSTATLRTSYCRTGTIFHTGHPTAERSAENSPTNENIQNPDQHPARIPPLSILSPIPPPASRNKVKELAYLPPWLFLFSPFRAHMLSGEREEACLSCV